MAGTIQAVTIVPDMGTFATTLINGAAKAAMEAGAKATNVWSAAFNLTDEGKTKALVDHLTKSQAEIKRLAQLQTHVVEEASGKLKAANAESIRAIQDLADAEAKHGRTSQQYADAKSRQAAALAEQRKASGDLKEATKELQDVQTRELDVTGRITSATGALENQKTAWSNVTSTLGTAREGFTKLDGALGGVLTKLTDSLSPAKLFTEAWDSSLEMETGLARASAALDLTAAESERMGEVAGSLYSQAYGTSLGEMTTSVTTVMSVLSEMRSASAEDLEAVTGAALTMADTFGIDVATSTTTVRELLRDGLAPDAITAFDMMMTGLQDVDVTLQSGLINTLKEHSGTFAEFGLTGDQAIRTLIDSSNDGMLSFESIGGALGELSRRTGEMSEETATAYATAGLSADDMATRFSAGGATASGALVDLAGSLLGMEDPSLRAQTALALFGDPIAGLTETEIPDFLTGIAAMNDGLGDYAGKSDEIHEKQSTTATAIDELRNSFSALLTEGLEPVIGPAMDIIKFFTDVPGGAEALGIALGTLAAVVAVYTAAQLAMNVAQMASPTTWIIMAIVAALGILTAIAVLIVENWDSIKEAAGKAVEWMLEKWEPIGAWFSGIWDGICGAASAAWEGIKSFLKSGWDFVDEHIFGPFKTGIAALGTAFEAAKDVISTAWGKVKSAAAVPINFVINKVYNDGIKAMWDKIANAVGLTSLTLPKINPIDVSAEANGTEDHRAQIAPAGAWRLWAEPETGGEAYIPLAPAKRERSTSILDTVAQGFGYSLVPFGDGGFFGDVWDNLTGAASAAWDWTKDKASTAARFLADPVAALGELITKPMNSLLEKIGAGSLGELISGVPRKAVGWVIDAAKKLVGIKNDEATKAAGGPIPGGAGMGWQAMWNIVRSAFPSAVLTSAQRNGAITAVGTKSLHSMGRAVDLSPSMAIFDFLKANFPHSTELIYSPAGAGQLYKGRNHFYGEPTRGMHFNHVHWGMADGGVLDSAFWRVLAQGGVLDDRLERTLYDSGGLLQPGLTLVENRTGKPEPVLTSDEFDRLTRRSDDGPRYALTINNHERPLTARDVVSATRHVELLNPRR